ncbi:MAG: YdeI/OmpD-associated family protein [Planctomycetota bacterium]|jgi:uncharacterized protein YdeI (YjbR/CyaY-like superfamily)
MKQLYIRNRKQWRGWLLQNHTIENEVWLIFYKKETGKPIVPYDATVEEALCFGWIDSIIKKNDDTKYARKFIRRNDSSRWSALNKRRAAKMIKEGKMTKAGLSKIKTAKKTGHWNPVGKPKIDFAMSAEFKDALSQNQRAKDNFEKLAVSYRKQYIGWINFAKRTETKKKRIAESIALLEKGKKLGLK